MGKYEKGILGAFSGKVGTVVGATWNGIHYMRSLPTNRKDPKTEKQLAQRQRFRLMTSFLRKFRPVVNIGFKHGAGNMAAVNRAMSYNVKNAISGEYPDFEILYENLVFSRGDLMGSHNALAESNSPGEVSLAWTDNSEDGSAKAEDTLTVVLYSIERDSVFYRLHAAERQDGSLNLSLPDSFQGDTVEVYLFFADQGEEAISDSEHLGQIQVQEQV